MQKNTNNNKRCSQFHSLLDTYIMPEGRVSIWSKYHGSLLVLGQRVTPSFWVLGPEVTLTYKTSSIFCIREALECRWIYNMVNAIEYEKILFSVSSITGYVHHARKNMCPPGPTITGDRSLLVLGQRVTPSLWVLGYVICPLYSAVHRRCVTHFNM